MFANAFSAGWRKSKAPSLALDLLQHTEGCSNCYTIFALFRVITVSTIWKFGIFFTCKNSKQTNY